jgi:hypothetical protein
VGGGGAGGYRTSTQSVTPGTTITITVGDGGAGGTNMEIELLEIPGIKFINFRWEFKQ